MARSTITDHEREFVETWENIATYQNTVIKLNSRGDEYHEVILGENKSFTITTEERMITQERILDTKHDPFLNGSFRPVNVPDDITIETNPNALSDQEILDIFSSSEMAWGEWMKLLDSPATLTRMVDLADDAPGATVKRLREVEARLRQVNPKKRLTSKDEVLQDFIDQESKASEKSDKAGKPERRGQGGRSSAYR